MPTEEEWERLARGRHGREYPWGNKWQEGVSNTDESEIKQTTAVGLFPRGVSPPGAYDCTGNVWEWCLDWYDEKKRARVLRGGAWDYLSYDCSNRFSFTPDDRYDYVGFRVLAAPISGILDSEFLESRKRGKEK